MRSTVRIAGAVVGRPLLWWTAVRQARRLVAAGWWRRRPFLPLPTADYLAFRLQTQYGDTEHPPSRADVLNYLEWCRDWDRG